MRKVPARFRAVLINRAVVSFQKDASVFGASQDQFAAIFGLRGVPFDELGAAHSNGAGEAIEFPPDQAGFRYFAAIGAGAAIDLLFDLFRHAAEAPLLHVMRLHETPEPF